VPVGLPLRVRETLRGTSWRGGSPAKETPALTLSVPLPPGEMFVVNCLDSITTLAHRLLISVWSSRPFGCCGMFHFLAISPASRAKRASNSGLPSPAFNEPVLLSVHILLPSW